MSAPTDLQSFKGAKAADPAPAHILPMISSSAEVKWSSGDDSDGYERGVYVRRGTTWQYIAPLPYVLDVIKHDSGSQSFRLSMSRRMPSSKPVTLVAGEDLGHGGWAEALGVTLPADPKIRQSAETAIRTVAESAPVVPSVPRWEDDVLSLPAADVGPAGYGVCAPITEDAARETWRELLAESAAAPKLALIAGAALGGLFIRSLQRQSFVAMLVGKAGHGKTTGVTLASAVLGYPGTGNDGVRGNWNVSPIGLVQELAQLACLPAIRDEYGAAGLTPQKTEAMILGVCQGASRTVGGKTGTPRKSGSWHSVLIATGNDSILGAVTNEGVARRLVEFAAPITRDATSAERVEELSGAAHGWPLLWLRNAGITPDMFAAMIEAIEAELPLPTAAVPRSLGRHLALAVAGVELLTRLVLDDDAAAGAASAARAAALELARTQLADSVREIAERGITPGERLLSAVVAAVAARPQNYPTRRTYREAMSDYNWTTLGTREVEGWALAGETSVDGDVAVLAQQIERICADAGITGAMVGLRELAGEGDAGRPGVLRAGDAEGRIVRDLRIGVRRKAKVYVFRLDEPIPTGDSPAGSETPDPSEPTGDTTGDSPDEAVTCENRSPALHSVSPRVAPVSPVRSATGDTTGDSSGEPVTSANTASKGALVPGVPGSAAELAYRPPTGDEGPAPVGQPEGQVSEPYTDPVGCWGPVLLGVAEPAPCRICGGGPVRSVDDGGPIHLGCALRGCGPDGELTPAAGADQVAAAGAADAAASTPAERLPERLSAAPVAAPAALDAPAPAGPVRAAEPVREGLRLAGVLDAAGLWLSGRAEPVALDAWPGDAAGVYRLAVDHTIGQVWVHPSAHELLGLPERDETISPAEPVADPWITEAAGVTTGDPTQHDDGRVDGLTAWMNLSPVDGATTGRRAVAVVAWESRAEWTRTRDGRELLAGVEAFAGALAAGGQERDARYYWSPNETSGAVLRTSLAAVRHPVTGVWGPPVLEMDRAGFDDHGCIAGEGGTGGEGRFRLPRAQAVRGLLDEEDTGGKWVHAFDRNGAQPGVLGALILAHNCGDGAGPLWVAKERPTVTAAAVKRTSGYYLARLTGRGRLDARMLPDLTRVWPDARRDDDAAWITGEWLTAVLEAGAAVEVVRSVTARSVERWMRNYGTTYSKGRAQLVAATAGHPRRCGCGTCAAYATWKLMWAGRVGAFAAKDSRRLYRPDVRDMVITRAYANQWRAAVKIADASGRFPLAQYVDALYYVSDSPDPIESAPTGMKLGTGVGQWKPEGAVPLAALREHDKWETQFHRVFVAERDAIGGAR